MTAPAGTRRFRFAPTPSRPLHVGSALAALVGWAAARVAGGTFILRIEDIDTTRCRPEHAEGLIADLLWLGLDWDEGPRVGGPFAPYVQSARLADYDAALGRLLAADLVYPCTCSRADIQTARSAPHLDALRGEGEHPYPGTCRAAGHEGLAEGRGGYRLAIDRCPGGGGRRSWQDAWLGPQAEDLATTCGDVLLGRPGQPTYQLAVVVDDQAMGVTDVVRGRDLLGSTARQLALHAALGHATPPAFGHHPLIVDAAGRKLSKRDEAQPLALLRASGVAPDRVVAAVGRSLGLLDAAVRSAQAADVASALGERLASGGELPREDSHWAGLDSA
jgi:glutamyl-tRNA synthetase